MIESFHVPFGEMREKEDHGEEKGGQKGKGCEIRSQHQTIRRARAIVETRMTKIQMI